ncbi:MAG: PIN domain-containing protein [Candidatus Micrarchaeota archaeon]
MLFDTYSWVELFNDTEAGRRVANLINAETAATAMATISELTSWAIRNNRDPSLIIENVKRLSAILEFREDIAKLAGELHIQYKKEMKDFGMVDSMIYATALANGLKLVTGDRHFVGKKDVEMI